MYTYIYIKKINKTTILLNIFNIKLYFIITQLFFNYV